MLRPRLLRATLPRFAGSGARSLHHMPVMDKFKDGIPGLMTPVGFEVAWTEYQGLLLKKLNALTADSEDYSSTPHKLLIKYARQPDKASLFNHASMAHNNHFFFECLSTEEKAIPATLKKNLIENFGSLDTLKKEFVAIGMSMFGPGFVWLAKTNENKYMLLNTYIAGSPYPGAHWRQQTRDMNTEADVKTPSDYARRQALLNSEPTNNVGSHGPLSGNNARKTAPGGVGLTPILCVSTWQHSYLPDWGISQKKEFLEAWWDRIDWDVVATNANSEPRPLIKG